MSCSHCAGCTVEEVPVELCEVIGEEPQPMDEDSPDPGDIAKEVPAGELVGRIEAVIEEYGEQALFPPLDGTSFYTRICKINHSCEPNVRVQYECKDTGLVASILSLRDIAAGEELLQSYIDQNMSKSTLCLAVVVSTVANDVHCRLS